MHSLTHSPQIYFTWPGNTLRPGACKNEQRSPFPSSRSSWLLLLLRTNKNDRLPHFSKDDVRCLCLRGWKDFPWLPASSSQWPFNESTSVCKRAPESEDQVCLLAADGERSRAALKFRVSNSLGWSFALPAGVMPFTSVSIQSPRMADQSNLGGRKRISTGLAGSLTSIKPISSVAQPCPTLCDPMDCSTPGLPVHHQLPEFIQTHVHWVVDAIQPSHPLSSPSPSALNLSQHQGLFKWVSSYKTKYMSVLWLSNSTSRYFPQRNESIYSPCHLHLKWQLYGYEISQQSTEERLSQLPGYSVKPIGKPSCGVSNQAETRLLAQSATPHCLLESEPSSVSSRYGIEAQRSSPWSGQMILPG